MWPYITKDGKKNRFEKKGDQWIEFQEETPSATFVEKARTADYVEIYDAKRDVTVRLFTTEYRWRRGANPNWFTIPRGMPAPTVMPAGFVPPLQR